MPVSPQLIFVPPSSTFTSNAADTIVAGGADTISMLAPGALAFGLTADVIIAGAADVIVGSASPTTISLGGTLPAADVLVAAAPGALLWSQGNTEVVNTGGADTIVSQPSQISRVGYIGSSPVGDTIFAAAGGGTYFIGGADVFAASGAGSSTVVGSVSYASGFRFLSVVPPTVFGGAENILYFAQPIVEGRFPLSIGAPTFLFDPQSGDSTIVTTTSDAGGGAISTSAGEAFVHDGGILNVVGSGSANQLIAGEGNATINAAGSTGYNTFFASSGNASLVGGSGSDSVSSVPNVVRDLFTANLFEASVGSTTIVGGSGRDWYQFTSGYAGGADLVQNWDANDQLQFFGYGTNPITSEAVSSGSTFITLSDGTRITIQGISDLNPAQVSSY